MKRSWQIFYARGGRFAPCSLPHNPTRLGRPDSKDVLQNYPRTGRRQEQIDIISLDSKDDARMGTRGDGAPNRRRSIAARQSPSSRCPSGCIKYDNDDEESEDDEVWRDGSSLVVSRTRRTRLQVQPNNCSE